MIYGRPWVFDVYQYVPIHVHVIVVSWFLQCMGYVPHDRGLYVLPKAEPEEVHTVRGRYISHAL